MSNIKILFGDNVEKLKEMPDNSVDSVVTDAPYGLGKEPNASDVMKDWVEKGYHEISGKGFMGNAWDAFIPQPLFWKEVFRVLKPGGHVLCFFGTRTYDWGVMSMRFAGFEIRDCIQWWYGTGFPKSLDVSKAIDKMGGERLDWFIDYILDVAKDRGISKKELTMLFPSKNGNPTGWLYNKKNSQSVTIKQYNIIKDFLNLPFSNIEEAKREVIGKGKAGLTNGSIANFSGRTDFDITKPETGEAKIWDGWGTSLKPANEPIVLARKPIEKGLNVAQNVLKWGTGGINIDRCRIAVSQKDIDVSIKKASKNITTNYRDKSDKIYGDFNLEYAKEIKESGRFPANIILSHSDYCSDLECADDCPVKELDSQHENASRFFYVAKPSGTERNKGLEKFPDVYYAAGNQAKAELKRGNIEFNANDGKDREERNNYNQVGSNKNFHPTVKPIKIMQYLVKMVTPPGGVCLDPFAGSGTTGVACKIEGFDCILIDNEQDFCNISQARVDAYEVFEEDKIAPQIEIDF